MITRQLIKSPARAETLPALAHDDDYVANRYFTDGASLYRVAGWLSRPGEEPLAELEDCHTLNSVLLERAALMALALQPVVTATAAA